MSGISPEEFHRFRDFLKGRSGIDLEDGKEYLVENRINPLARQHDVSLTELLAMIPSDAALQDEVIDAMTTNETSFFRDIHPFDAMRDSLIPEILERNAGTRQLSILSGASSTGQEAFSIAMMLRTHFPQLAEWDVRITGVDLSKYAVGRASEGRYTQLEVNRGLPASMLRWFRQEGRDFVVIDELRRWCTFRQMNLVAPWPTMGPFDISLLRNVLIYFDVPTKETILRRLIDVTAPGGAIFLGASETTISMDVPLTPERVGNSTVFRTPERSVRSWASPAMTSTS